MPKIKKSEIDMNDNSPTETTGPETTGPETTGLRDKVDAAKARLAERTGNARPAETVKSLIVEHPVASLAAGILLGALIAKALPTSGRFRKGAAGLASVAGKFAVDYATKAAEVGREGLHQAEEAGSKLADAGSNVGSRIAETGVDARRKANDLADVARAAAIEASELAIRKMTELASRIKH